MEQSGFISTQNKGFRMHFNNGFAISVQFGSFNYCSRKNYDDKVSKDLVSPKDSDFWTAGSAEVAVFDTNNRKQEYSDVGMISLGQDTVAGWLSSDQVAKVITIVQSAKTLNEIQTKLKALKIWMDTKQIFTNVMYLR